MDSTYQDILNKDILELMGAKDMPEEQKNRLYNKMLETVKTRVMARVADKLSDAEVEEWKKLSQQDKSQANQYLINKGLDINQLMLQEALMYKAEMAELTKPIRQAAQIK